MKSALTLRSGLIAASTALLFAVSMNQALAAGTPSTLATPAAATPSDTERASIARIEGRISNLHQKLGLTADQESLWTDVAQVMRSNEKKMRDQIAMRVANAKTMTAVDDLKSFQQITDEQADGLKRLIPSFQALYAKMTPTQQKNADAIFSAQQQRAARRS